MNVDNGENIPGTSMSGQGGDVSLAASETDGSSNKWKESEIKKIKRNLRQEFNFSSLKHQKARKTVSSGKRKAGVSQKRCQQFSPLTKKKLTNAVERKPTEDVSASKPGTSKTCVKKTRKKNLWKNKDYSSSEKDASLEEHLGEDLTGISLGITPMDVAAHLTMLGGNMTRLGMALDYLDNDVDATAMYSCLLDSLLCAIGPLLCLTRSISGLEDMPTDTFKKTLDHLAYFMPGVVSEANKV